MTSLNNTPAPLSGVRRHFKRRELRYLAGRMSPRLFYWLMYRREHRTFLSNLGAPVASSKTTVDSRAAYDAYDDREQREHATAEDVCAFRNRIVRMPVRQMRDEYLKYLFAEIDPILDARRPLRILEVGSGNGINLVALQQRYGGRVHLHGLDTSPRRIEVARNYYAAALRNVDFRVASITEPIPWPDRSFDLVFSMHCLEQIAYHSSQAVEQMYRLAGQKVVMMEPVYEFGNRAQRMYLVNADHNRILLKSIQQLGYDIARLEPLDIQSNPLNQSTLIVLNIPARSMQRSA